MSQLIYKICDRQLWRTAEATGEFLGAGVDLADGYIHFSTKSQVRETAAKHFAGTEDLLLITVSADALGDTLRWEPSRGGDLFPHLYSALPLVAVKRIDPLPLDASGQHVFPELA